jgi:hypothetical protein
MPTQVFPGTIRGAEQPDFEENTMMNRLNRKQLLAFGFWFFVFGFCGQQAWGQSDVTSFGGIKKIVIFQELNPWSIDQKNMDKETALLNGIHPHKLIIQDQAADYVRKNLDEKLKKCIEIVVPEPQDRGDYYEDPANRLLMITWDVDQWTLDGRSQTLASFSLSEAQPYPKSGGNRLIRTTQFMPTQAMLFHDEAQIDADTKIIAARLMTKIVHYINTSANSCGG